MAETKLDGWRALVTIDAGMVVTSRNGHRITDLLPEFEPLVDLGCPAVLDGRTRGSRWPMRGLLRHRLAALEAHEPPGAHLRGLRPAVARRPRHRSSPYDERRRLLVDLELPPPAVVVNQFDAADLDYVLEACESHGVEGVMLKRRDSTSRLGQRCDTWRKVKCLNWRSHAERRKIGRP